MDVDKYHWRIPYEPPSWAKRLKIQPTTRTVLCMRPTPIHKWAVPGVPADFQVWVKRDDLTGCTLTGNKSRKLEFLLADAIEQGCDTVVTGGGLQSNHCRTTAVAARELGLKSHVVLMAKPGESELPYNGNILLDRLSAATMVPYEANPDLTLEQKVSELVQRVQNEVDRLKKEGHKPYYINVGGCSPIGEWGYIDAFREMMDQGLFDRFDDIVMAAGTGGTVAGLAIANYLTGSKVRLHGVSVGLSLDSLCDKIDEILVEMGIAEVAARDLVDLVSGYEGVGNEASSEDKLSLIVDVFTKTGIALCPEFTAKAMRGMLEEMRTNPGRFAGKRVLFLLTGGMFELYDGRLDQILRDTAATNQVYVGTP